MIKAAVDFLVHESKSRCEYFPIYYGRRRKTHFAALVHLRQKIIDNCCLSYNCSGVIRKKLTKFNRID